MLIKELNHRLFNTFQIISNVLAKAERLGCLKSTSELLTDLNHRVQALSALHRLLALPFEEEPLEDRCRRICVELVRTYGRDDVYPWVRMDDVRLTGRQSLHIALLVVELVTNVLKHSLANEGGTVWVDLRGDATTLQLSVCDSRQTPVAAKGVPRIASMLAHSLAGEAFVVERGGYMACARFPLSDEKGREVALKGRAPFVDAMLAQQIGGIWEVGR